MFNRACLTAGCQTVTVRESTTPAAGPGLHYRRFAWAVLAVAVLVAIGASDFDRRGSDAAQAATVPAATVAAKPRAKLVRPAASWATADEADVGLAEQGESGEGAEPQTNAEAPPTPGSSVTPPSRDVAVSGQADQPAPGEVGHLVAASHARSGGVDQGDKPVG